MVKADGRQSLPSVTERSYSTHPVRINARGKLGCSCRAFLASSTAPVERTHVNLTTTQPGSTIQVKRKQKTNDTDVWHRASTNRSTNYSREYDTIDIRIWTESLCNCSPAENKTGNWLYNSGTCNILASPKTQVQTYIYSFWAVCERRHVGRTIRDCWSLPSRLRSVPTSQQMV